MSNYDSPAFPCEQHERQDGCWNQTFRQGRTLRDYFAAQALMSFTTLKNPDGLAVNIQWTAARIATKCYEIADAMLEARKVQS